ncbi:hypothetical protein JA33_032 [Dickeya phage vB_DsoM_JA33]|uniref:Uncharacterized protein n=3 Tax=Salmondvirus JA11 TaxID=2734141 RepID=A0A384ZW29_9CAUD|nr:hypothetical protein HOU32_gp032 [Dickeya phage vB_DsoM_JA11]AXG66436.1 hypothetical protein JA13_033 [Dickeya phage vB_DsoM_JA13]AXG67406.1 hypothetical protein JA33_032 [Dickeya phage vB_DsoM_JA33]AYD79837.1 hypothetical protein JA11_032 [Dickeya phage vB_DsoM_JA11]
MSDNSRDMIDLPEIYFSPEWREANPDTDPMQAIPKQYRDVLLEKQDRHVTIIRPIDEDTESNNMFTCAMDLPIPPNVLRSVIEGHMSLEVFCTKKQLVLVGNKHFDTVDLFRFYGWRDKAKEILAPLYVDLWQQLKKIPDMEFYVDHAEGILVRKGGVDLSGFYTPFELVSRAIAAHAIHEKVVMQISKVNSAEGETEIVVPEITGNVTYEDMAAEFNKRLKPLQPLYEQNGIFTAFFARSSTHDGIDIVSVLPNGMGGYVNLSLTLSLYLYGNNLMQPKFKQEGDMFMVSCEDTDAFVAADVAAWINFEEMESEYNLC